FSFDLSEYDIPATIMLPDETVGIGTSFIPEIKHNEADFLWEINIGPYFVFLIEDYGEIKNLVNQQKSKLMDSKNSIYSINFLVNEPELIVYERKIKDVGDSTKSTYHAYAQKKINGVYYEFKTIESGYSKKVIDCFEKSFRSIKEIPSK
ncbi:MAG: hypothetical protein ACKO7D_03940, partial [Bacteroidota bacterium]